MLNKDIINIKNILKIIISVLVIFSMLRSCANAWSWDDFCDFIEETQDIQTDSELKTAGQYLLNNRTYCENQLSNLSVNPNNYSTIFLKYNSSSIVGLELYFYTKNDNSGYWYVNGSNQLQYTSDFVANGLQVLIQKPNNNGFKQNYNFKYHNMGKVWGLIDTEPATEQFGNLILQNAYNYISILPRENLSTTNLPWYIADGRIGNKYINDNLSYYLNGENIKKSLQQRDTVSTPYILSQLSVTDTINLINGGTYNITLESDTTTYLTSANFVLSWEEQQGETESGDTSGESGGSIDLTNIENNLTEIKDTVKDIPQNIGKVFYNSGDSGEKGIIQKVYEELFTVSSGEIKDKIETFYEEIGYDSGDVSGELKEATAGLDVINGNFGDFVISWNSYNPNLTVKGQQVGNSGEMIPAGEINFSKFERENPVIQDVMRYVRAILSFSIFVMLGKNIWSTLMVTLGISPSIYDKATEESRTAKANEEKSKNKLKSDRK